MSGLGRRDGGLRVDEQARREARVHDLVGQAEQVRGGILPVEGGQVSPPGGAGGQRRALQGLAQRGQVRAVPAQLWAVQ